MSKQKPSKGHCKQLYSKQLIIKLMRLVGLVVFVGFIGLLVTALFFGGCSKKGGNQLLKAERSHTITISEQFGLAYAPVQVMRLLNLIEEEDPSITVKWVQLENTAAIREAMVAGRLDIGFGGIPPFLIGWDSGMDWKIAVGLSSAPLGLVSKKESVQNLDDFNREDKIILPQPGSIQHILLAMALERNSGNAHLLDDNLLTMSHPDGLNAMLSDPSVTAHFTAPPYLFTELEQDGFQLILTGEEAMGGPFTFIVGSATEDLFKNRQDIYQVFIRAISKAIQFITDNPDKTADLLAPEYGIDRDTLHTYLTYPGMQFSTVINGVMDFAQFMKRIGYIQKVPGDSREVIWGAP
jgi:NitT/TauT family transport system substrate-binding protein